MTDTTSAGPAELRFQAAGVLGAGVLGALAATTRTRRLDAEHYLALRREGRPVLFVFWHAHLLPLVHAHRGEGIVTLVSEHADGEYLSRTIGHLGYDAVRGSSTRGGTRALRGLVRRAREGRDLALTPDGPRGPARVFKPGALAVAQAAGIPVLPMAVAASPAWRLRSWDALLLPRPFARICIAYGAPRDVPRTAGREELAGMALELGDGLDALEAKAEREVGR